MHQQPTHGPSPTTTQGWPRPSSATRRICPEVEVGGFHRYSQQLQFYARVNALLGPESVVVDLGAGRGEWADSQPSAYVRDLMSFRGRVGEVIGVDIDPVVATNPTVDRAVIMDDAMTMSGVASASVDLIVARAVLEHVADPSTFAAEVDRVLRPGGWMCAWTPNKWGCVALAARAVPNDSHVSALRRLQHGRQARDVFPTAYRLNTRRSIRRWFPAEHFDDFTYTYGGLPSYYGNSVVLGSALLAYEKIVPRPLNSHLHVFLRKAGPERAG
ncbi:MAG: class I SAM-dependent methyltransferase [Acidimicrobiales bacterium]